MVIQLLSNTMMVGLVAGAVWGVADHPFMGLGAAFISGVLAAMSAVYAVRVVPAGGEAPKLGTSGFGTPHGKEG